MYYGAIKQFDIANGDGCRTSLFVSGCRNRCPGCFNPETWNFTYGETYTDDTLERVLELLGDPNISGLSVLGGDPFEPENQSGVLILCKKAKDLYPSKSIWVWTGYLCEDLKDLPVMKYIDVLVDGPFIESLKSLKLKWRGSSNQRVIDVQKSLKTGSVELLEFEEKSSR